MKCVKAQHEQHRALPPRHKWRLTFLLASCRRKAMSCCVRISKKTREIGLLYRWSCLMRAMYVEKPKSTNSSWPGPERHAVSFSVPKRYRFHSVPRRIERLEWMTTIDTVAVTWHERKIDAPKAEHSEHEPQEATRTNDGNSYQRVREDHVVVVCQQ